MSILGTNFYLTLLSLCLITFAFSTLDSAFGAPFYLTLLPLRAVGTVLALWAMNKSVGTFMYCTSCRGSFLHLRWCRLEGSSKVYLLYLDRPMLMDWEDWDLDSIRSGLDLHLDLKMNHDALPLLVCNHVVKINVRFQETWVETFVHFAYRGILVWWSWNKKSANVCSPCSASSTSSSSSIKLHFSLQ